jgi:hypothetical protein
VLLDVDGLRHGLHLAGRVLVGQWARFVLHLGDEERVRDLHRRTAERLGRTRAPWEAVRRQVEALERRRAVASSTGASVPSVRTDEGLP